MRLGSRFFERAEQAWRAIDDPHKRALTVLVDGDREHVPVWTKVRPQRVGAAWKTQWVDQLCVLRSSWPHLRSRGYLPTDVAPLRAFTLINEGSGDCVVTEVPRGCRDPRAAARAGATPGPTTRGAPTCS